MNASVLPRNSVSFRIGWNVILITSGAVALALGLFSPTSGHRILMPVMLLLLAITLVGRVLSRLLRRPIHQNVLPEKSTFTSEMEVMTLSVLALSIFLQATGVSIFRWMVLTYWMELVFAVFVRPAVAFVGAAMLYLSAGFLVRQANPTFAGNDFLIAHALFLMLFGGTGMLLRTAETALRRIEERRRRQQQIKYEQQEFRDFRLTAPVTSENARDRAQQDELLRQASLAEVHDHIAYELQLFRESLSVTSAVLLWMDTVSQKLRIVEAASVSSAIDSRFLENGLQFSALKGVVGNIVRNQVVLNMAPFPFGSSALAYYAGTQTVGSFLGIPVFEQGRLVGVLCCDREIPEPFSEAQVQLAQKGAAQMLRTVATERLFMQMARSKFEQEKLYQALSYMNHALDVESVVKAAVSAVTSICPVEEIALVHWEHANEKAVIVGAYGELLAPYVNQPLDVSRSLMKLAMENRHFLPVNGELHNPRQVVIHESILFHEMGSVLVQPLIEGDHSIGAMVFAARARGVFTAQRRDMLGALSNQIAIGLQKALMYRRMEEMATTDGLTGLTNHRAFQERFAEMIARAERMQTPLTALIIDIDKFKRINDTYGHPIGDVVIRGVAGVLKRQARAIDMAARYGGEEFAMVMEATDAEGARVAAERIRQEVEAMVFDSPLGPFKATLSIGFASFPIDGTHKQQLIDRADRALYWAKEHGRNQVVYYGAICKEIEKQ